MEPIKKEATIKMNSRVFGPVLFILISHEFKYFIMSIFRAQISFNMLINSFYSISVAIKINKMRAFILFEETLLQPIIINASPFRAEMGIGN